MLFPVVLPAWLAGRTRSAEPPSVRSRGSTRATLPFGITMEKNHVDEIMCHLQGTSNKAEIVGFDPLPMRVGVAGAGVAGSGVGARRGSRETHRVLGVNNINNVDEEVCMRINAASRLGEPLRRKSSTTSSSPPTPTTPAASSSLRYAQCWANAGTSSCTTQPLKSCGSRSLGHGCRNTLTRSRQFRVAYGLERSCLL